MSILLLKVQNQLNMQLLKYILKHNILIVF